jgi:hypothetical protein
MLAFTLLLTISTHYQLLLTITTHYYYSLLLLTITAHYYYSLLLLTGLCTRLCTRLCTHSESLTSNKSKRAQNNSIKTIYYYSQYLFNHEPNPSHPFNYL